MEEYVEKEEEEHATKVSETEAETEEYFAEQENLFSRLFKRRKRYGLFYRDGRKTFLETVIVARNPPTSYEIEAQYGELDANRTWLLCEVDEKNNPKGSPYWIKRKRFSRRESREMAPWEKLSSALKESIEPMKETFRAVAELRKGLNEIIGPLYEGEPEAEGESSTQLDDVLALKIKAYEEAGKAMGEAMGKAFSSMADAFSKMMFPWQIPEDFPMWARLVAHPGVRQGLKEVASDLVKEVTKSAVEGVTEAVGKTVVSSPTSTSNTTPPLSEIVSKSKKEAEEEEESAE